MGGRVYLVKLCAAAMSVLVDSVCGVCARGLHDTSAVSESTCKTRLQHGPVQTADNGVHGHRLGMHSCITL